MLAARIPSWFEVVDQAPDHLDGLARVPGTLWQQDGIDIRALLSDPPTAREIVPGTVLPKLCYERHLLPDSRFCMRLHGTRVLTADDADLWWDQLAQYLMCQSTASETGLWPSQHAIDHGRAGPSHARALELADALGLQDEYAAVHGGFQRGFSQRTTRRLRFKPRFRELVAVEAERRRALAQWNRDMATSGLVCCGTMRDCPLPREKEDAPAEPLPTPELGLRGFLMTTASRLVHERAAGGELRRGEE